MDFSYNQKQLQFQQKAREFIEKEMAPKIEEYDRRSIFAKEAFLKFGEQGFLGVIVPQEFGGLALGTMEYCLLSEELGRLSAGYHHNGIFQTQKMIMNYGTQEQKKRFLPGLASGKFHAATAISEPAAGSSFAKIKTFARNIKDNYILNGVKNHINDAAEADILNLLARTERGLTIFLLEKGTPGFKIKRKLDPIGLRASPIYEFELKESPIPKENLLGQEGEGLSIFVNTFNFSRLGNASVFLGMAKAAMEEALNFAEAREIGDQNVIDFQGIRWIVAELYTQLEAAELLRNKGATLDETEGDSSSSASMAKLFCGEVAVETIMAAIRITGSHGCYRDKPFERWLRDAKALEIAGGTPEIMKNIVADQILKKERNG
ncbi:MAG: acyl-CoA dehydrogenase family protein [Desulfobacterales bacterium]|jgi:alkylation response protein AidB-like acyl-CoA dehydrogenase|nr:acyl-CoA dehydrogenase family protein [Desulfobacterales bacterium]|tara:strand:- start:140 stop:1270 length:1131 start_codon:yes stop_codon:yes gene_type:complete